ncbi:MAG TPA: proton-conducting transporter membrane subunit [Micromonosporaceae bacterium]|nr:proton-conducting transporter membrane subunit [Micromonosporaceae bacterium]
MIDSVALLPTYAAAGTAVLVLLVDLLLPGRRAAPVAVAAAGALLTAVAAGWVGSGPVRATFCSAGAGCSFVADPIAALVAGVFAFLTLAVLGLSWPLLRAWPQAGTAPAGEYAFLLSCSLAGGVVLGGARDLITLIVAVETLTLPLYILVGLRRRTPASASAAVTFFLVSVVSTAVALLGAALLYAATGAVHFARLGAALAPAATGAQPPGPAELVGVGAVLLLGGLAFKVAAVPMHAWAPTTYDGAPVPIAGYLSTASKLGGVVAIVLVVTGPLRSEAALTGPVLGTLAVLTMTVGNLVALRQRRMIRLLAWSSVAQSGYILAPLAVTDGRGPALAYTIFYVVLELGAFAAIVALRGAADGGLIADYRGVARRSPWIAGALILALAGLAGLPPGLAGLFAKVTIVRPLIDGGAGWLAVVVVLNAVIGLAYYLRTAVTLFAPAPTSPGDAVETAAPRVAPGIPDGGRLPGGGWPVLLAVGATAVLAVVLGFLPQIVLDAAQADLVIR